jgi:hypothetical protein
MLRIRSLTLRFNPPDFGATVLLGRTPEWQLLIQDFVRASRRKHCGPLECRGFAKGSQQADGVRQASGREGECDGDGAPGGRNPSFSDAARCATIPPSPTTRLKGQVQLARAHLVSYNL